jgi:imidazolonepropionase-like amidohydrolase
MRRGASLTVLMAAALSIGGAAYADAPAKTIIHAGHLIADPGKPALERQSIVIESGKITAVVAGYIDLTQAWVMPGLIDMHTHVRRWT